MRRTLYRLSVRKAETIKTPGRHADGGNLYLSISPTGARRWMFLYSLNGKQREMGLGGAGKGGVSLASARARAAEARSWLTAGLDPIVAREKAAHQAAVAQAPTFGKMADEYIAAMKPSWRSAKHARQWEYTLRELAAPLRAKRVNQIETVDIVEVLQPVWKSIPETASRLRGRIETVLDAAKAKGFRQGENPARWRGHLRLLLPSQNKASGVHHLALPYKRMAEFMAKLRESDALAARALEFTILCACRTTEARGARWEEIDLEKQLWTIPPIRMKGGREHRVPLSDRVQAIIEELAKTRRGPFVFPGNGSNRCLSSTAMFQHLRRMGFAKITAHGFRSSFRDWASETTSFPHEACEAALAHVIPNKAESAYRRGDILAKCAELMADWADYCEPGAGKVVPLTRGVKGRE